MKKINLQEFLDFCDDKPIPIKYTMFFYYWMTKHFSDPDNLEYLPENPSMANLLWDPDPLKTNLVISTAYDWKPENTNKKPGIIISRVQHKRHRLGLYDQKFGEIPFDPLQTLGSFEVAWEGAHVLACISTNPAESEYLASEVSTEINQNAKVFYGLLNLKDMFVAQILPISILEEAPFYYATPVYVAYIYHEAWAIEYA
jgi:hypothetical protein